MMLTATYLKNFLFTLVLGLFSLIYAQAGVAAPQAIAGTKWVNVGPAPIKNSYFLGGDLSGRHSDFAVDPANPAHWLSATAGGIWETLDSGATWAARTDFLNSLGTSALSFGATIGTERNVYAATGAGGFIGLGIGPLRSVDGGTTWQKMTTSPSFVNRDSWAIRASPSAAGTVVMAVPSTTDQGVWKTTDANAASSTWTKVLPGYASDLQVSKTNFSYQIAAISNNGLYRTVTAWEPNAGGDRWEKINGPWQTAQCDKAPPATGTQLCGVGFIKVAVAPSDHNVVYVSVSNYYDYYDPTTHDIGNEDLKYGKDDSVLAMWRIDGAFTATPTYTQLPDWRVGNAVRGGAPYSAYGSYFEGGSPVIMRVDPTNKDILYMGMVLFHRFDGTGGAAAGDWSNAGIYTSPTSQTTTVHVDIFGIAWAGQKLILGTDGGVYASPDPATTPFPWTNIPWEERNSNQSTIQFVHGAIHPSNAGGMLGGVWDNGWLTRRNGEWQFFSDGDGNWNFYSKSNPDNYWISGYGPTSIGRRLRMANGDLSETSVGLDSALLATGESNDYFNSTIEQCPSKENIFVVGTNRVWKSINIFATPEGVSPSWTALWNINSPPSGYNGAKISAFAFAPTDTNCNTFAFGTVDGQVWFTQTGGSSWKRIQDAVRPIEAVIVTDLEFNPKNVNVLYLAQGKEWYDELEEASKTGGNIYRVDALTTTPLVTEITPSLNGKSANYIKAIAIDPYNAGTATTMYVGTVNGTSGGVLWKTTNAHAASPTWTQYTPADGLPNVSVNSLQLNETTGKLVAFTWGRGAFMLAPPVDLVTTAAVGPALIIRGTQVTLSDTVCNQGYNAAASSNVNYYLSSDALITTTDTLVGSRTVGALAANSCNSGSIAWNVSATQLPGTFYIGAIADVANAVGEGNENNNMLAGNLVVIAARPDLIMSNLTANVTTTTKNGVTTIKLSVADQVKNQGTAAAGSFSNGFYLSTDLTLDTTTDILTTCSRTISSLAATKLNPNSGTTTSTCPIPSSAVKGAKYYVFGVADSANAVVESNEENNSRRATAQITVP